MRSFLYLPHIWVVYQAKKNIFHKKKFFYHILNIKSSFLKFIFFASHSTQIYSKDQNDLKNEFVFHNYQIKIYDLHSKIRSFSKGKVHKNMKSLNLFEKVKNCFLLGTLLKYVLGIKLTSKINFDIIIWPKLMTCTQKLEASPKVKCQKNMKFLNFFEKNEELFFAWHATKICSRYKNDLNN